MSDERIERDFYSRTEEDQTSLLTHTWCDACQEVDLGMSDPEEYELRNTIFIEGRCLRCGGSVYTELTEDEF